MPNGDPTCQVRLGGWLDVALRGEVRLDGARGVGFGSQRDFEASYVSAPQFGSGWRRRVGSRRPCGEAFRSTRCRPRARLDGRLRNGIWVDALWSLVPLGLASREGAGPTRWPGSARPELCGRRFGPIRRRITGSAGRRPYGRGQRFDQGFGVPAAARRAATEGISSTRACGLMGEPLDDDGAAHRTPSRPSQLGLPRVR